MATYKTGSDIDTSCTRCKLELAHVIVAMDGVKILRVQCKTCGSLHAYRGKTTEKAKATPRVAASTSRSASSAKRSSTSKNAESSFSDYVEGKDLSRAETYKPTSTYIVDSVVLHPTFGMGIVTRLMSDSKIQVLFQQGEKILVHERS